MAYRSPITGRLCALFFQSLEKRKSGFSNRWKIARIAALLIGMAWPASADVIFNESGRTGSIPAGWTADGVYPETAAGGYLRVTNNIGWLATPSLDLSAYTNVQLSFTVAKFGAGGNGPLTVQVSTNAGASWDAQVFDSPIPVSSTYSNSGPTEITALSSHTRIRWTAVNSPSQKRLRDILLTGDLPPAPQEIPPYPRFQGFEGTQADYWTYQTFPGDGRIAVSLDERGQTGRYALKLTGSEDGHSNPYVLFDNVDLTGLSDVVLSVAFAARGVDNNDDLYLDLSYDNGATWPDAVQLMNGFNNFNLDFGQTDVDRSVGTNPYIFDIGPMHTQVRVRVRFDEAAAQDNRFDHYYIDDIHLTATGQQPFIRFEVAERVVTEGDGSVTIPVTISEPADAVVRVRFHGSAQAGTDYTIGSTTLVFSAAGSTTNHLELSILSDPQPRGPRLAWFTLEHASGARLLGPDQATVVIRDTGSLSVMAANLPSGTNLVNGFFPYDEAAKRIFRLLRPDVIAIQEWILLPGETLQDFVDEQVGEGFHYHIEPTAFPNGVISRWPILDAGEWVDDEVGNRDFVWATIDLPGARNLHIVSVHFKAGQTPDDRDARIRQARALTNYIAQADFPAIDYLVVAGDLNLAGRNEETIQILEHYVSDAIQPADQNGERQTNIPRNQHYDFVLPSPLLEASHLPFDFGGFSFDDGLVFDSRLWDEHLLPVRVGDSADTDMQHLAVLKLFALEDYVLPPESFAATAVNPSTIELSWTGNPDNDDVLIVFNADGEFTVPAGVPPAAGQPFAGGTVLYVGDDSPVLHDQLSGCATYHYAIWSVDGENYSSQRSANALLSPPTAPTGLSAEGIGVTQAVVHWDSMPDVSEYRLDVSPIPSFVEGGEGGVAGTNTFAPIGGEPTSAYQTRHWTNAGVTWTAYKARTDQTVDALDAITFQNQGGAYMVSESITGGVGTITFVHQQKFSGSGGTLEVRVNDVSQAIIPIQTTVQTAVVSGINVSGPFTLVITNSGTVRPAIAELTWTSFEEEVPLLVDGFADRLVPNTYETVTGLTAGVTYYYRVLAQVDPCASGYSAVGSFTTLNDPNIDTDGDGIPDWWEEQFFGGPTNAVATNLAANSVNTILEAYIADLDPTDATVVLQLGDEGVVATTNWFRFVPSSTGRVYDLYWRTSLLHGTWSAVGLDVPGTGAELFLGVTNEVSDTYWRAGVRLP